MLRRIWNAIRPNNRMERHLIKKCKVVKISARAYRREWSWQ